MTVQQIGPYKVVRQLGVGGCGVVYEAVHGQLGRRAAVKVLHGDIASDKEIATRFLNEARAISQVEHPGVVRVLEVGQQEDGAPFIALELLQGRSLQERLRELTYGDALRLVRQMAATLAAAHERGIVHRDLKPENVMVVPDDDAPGGERAKVLDFGIAKLTDGYDGPGARALKTRTGITMGTPTYMSPEQCRGLRGIDGKSDVYSLGVMLYEMLGGRVPFSAKGDGEVMAMHVYREPAPLRELIPSLPAPVEALVHQMLDKAPERRPAMKEVAERLAQALAAAPPVAGGEVLHTRRELEVSITVVAPAAAPEPSTPREVRAVSPPHKAAALPPSQSEAPTRLVLSSTPGLRPPAPRPPAPSTTTAAAARPRAPWRHRGLVIGVLVALVGAAAITHLVAGHLSGAADGAAVPGPSAPAAAPAPAPPAAIAAPAAAPPAPASPEAAPSPRAPKAPPRAKRPPRPAARPAAPQPGVIVE